MKKLYGVLSVILVILTLFISIKIKDYDKGAAIVTLAIILLLFLAYLHFESSKKGTKEIALIATLSAFGAAARIPFVAIPNVQPTTFIIALSGYVFGPYEGFLIGSTTAFLSNIFLGQGPWTPWQMMAWGIIGLVSGLLRSKKPMRVEIFALICFFYGFIFDWIMNLWHIIGFVRPINLKTVLLAYLTGITFDFMHGLGNFIFTMIFYEKFIKVLNRFKQRLTITYIK